MFHLSGNSGMDIYEGQFILKLLKEEGSLGIFSSTGGEEKNDFDKRKNAASQTRHRKPQRGFRG